MPYLEFMYCDRCKVAPLDIDYKKTIESYHKDGRREKDVFINPGMIVWDYLVYTCNHCGYSKPYNFRDVELKVREHLSNMSEQFREYFESIGNVDFSFLENTSRISKTHKESEQRVMSTYGTKK